MKAALIAAVRFEDASQRAIPVIGLFYLASYTEKYVPGITKNPMLQLAKQMALEKVLAMPQAKQAGITEEMVTKVLGEINAHK